MGTNCEYSAENFNRILSSIRDNEAELALSDDFVDLENGLESFNFSNLNSLNSDEINIYYESESINNLDDIDSANLGLVNNNNCSSVDSNEIDYYEQGFREGFREGFIRGNQESRE